MRRLFTVLIAVLAVGTFFSTTASAQYFTATLDGAQETPPIAGKATGYGCFYLFSGRTGVMLHYEISYTSLSSLETGAHIHVGNPGVAGPILFPLPAGSPKSGDLGPLTLTQQTQLVAGQLYVNVHSFNFPNGEIRGQILGSTAPCTIAVQESTWGAVKTLYR